MAMDMAAVQYALRKAGFDPGPIDGVYGPRTRAAVIAFQKSKNLTPDGIVGRFTRRALLGPGTTDSPRNIIPTEYAWLIEAERLLGVKEIPGSAHNPVILDWAKALSINYTEDEIPWCGLFVAHCIRTALPDAILPDNPLGARQWIGFGRKLTTPEFGAVMTFWRRSPMTWHGHVGFYWAEDSECYHIIGGNQSNKVGIDRLPKARLLAATWPEDVRPLGIIRHADARGVISENEQ